MAKAFIAKELVIVTENKVGMLEQVTSAISEAGVNIDALCAYVMGDKATFEIVTQGNARATKVLAAKNFRVDEKDVVIVELENKVGAAKETASVLKKAGIDLTYIYGTTCSTKNCRCRLVFTSNNNAKAVEVLNK